MAIPEITKSWETLHEMGGKFFALLPNLIIALLLFVIFWFLGATVRSLVRRAAERKPHGRNLALVLGRLVDVLFLLFGLLVAVTVVVPTFHVANLIQVLGVGSIAIGFAFRDILQNFLAGILLLVNEPFRLGDQIRIEDYEGTVDEIQTRATLIKTYDGRRVVIPNADLYTKAVTVNTAFGIIRSESDIGIGYGADIETAKRIIVEATRSVKSVIDDPEPEALTLALAESTVNIRARWWTRPADKRTVLHTTDQVLIAIKNRLTAAGIDLPFPTRQILFQDQTPKSDGNRRPQRDGSPASTGETARANSNNDNEVRSR